MSSIFRLQISSQLPYSCAERGRLDNKEVGGGAPPLRIVPTASKREPGEVVPTVKVKYPDATSQNLNIFDGHEANTEAILLHLEGFREVAEKMGIMSEYNALPERKDMLKRQLAKAGPTYSTRTIDSQHVMKTDKEWIVYDIEACKSRKKELTSQFYILWEKLLIPSLHSEWRKIVREQCQTEGYLEAGGIRKTGKRGVSIEAFWYCHKAWMLQVVPQNAAELHRAYLSNQIFKPDSISIEAFNARVKRLNGWMPDLPTLKDVEGSPETMPRGDIKMDEVELCLAILRALPKYLTDHYTSVKGRNHCAVSVRKLTSDLMDIEPQAKSFKKLKEELRAQGKLKSGSSGNPNKKSSGSEGATAVTSPQKSQLTGRIPRKVRNTKTESSQPLTADSVQKHCNSCQQWSPRNANNHNTKECRTWNPDGTRKAKKFRPSSNSTPKASFAMQKVVEQMETKMAQLEKSNKKMKKLLNKKVKGRSKKRKYASSTDMSDSDSE